MGLGDASAPLFIVGGPQDTTVSAAAISAQNTAPVGPAVAPALSTCTIAVNGKATAAFQVSANTLNVALQAYGSIDGLNWVLIGGTPLLNQATGRWQPTVPAAAVGIFTMNCADFAFVRLSTPNSAVTGSATVSAEAGTSPAIVTLEASQFNFVRAAADLQAKAGAGVLHSVSIAAQSAAPVAGLLSIYDSLTETGTVIYSEWVVAGALPHTIVLDTSFATGCFIGFDATLAGVAVTAALL